MTNWIRESNLIEGVDDFDEDARSLKAWEWVKDQPLTLMSIRGLHGKIMAKQLPEEERGKWRKCGVVVGGRVCPHYSSIPVLMKTWVVAYGDMKQESLIRIGHIEFEKVHPFVDGNGRTGRMVMNLQRLQAGFDPLMLRADERGAYYEWFRGRK